MPDRGLEPASILPGTAALLRDFQGLPFVDSWDVESAGTSIGTLQSIGGSGLTRLQIGVFRGPSLVDSQASPYYIED